MPPATTAMTRNAAIAMAKAFKCTLYVSVATFDRRLHPCASISLTPSGKVTFAWHVDRLWRPFDTELACFSMLVLGRGYLVMLVMEEQLRRKTKKSSSVHLCHESS